MASRALRAPGGEASSMVIGHVVGDAAMREASVSCLEKFGVDRVLVGLAFADLLSATAMLGPGDLLVVPSLDHLGVSMWRVFDMLDDLRARDVGFVSIGEGVDTREERVSAALDIMRSVLSAERRLVSRRSAEARARAVDAPPPPPGDPLLERSRKVAAPWIDDVREHRPRMTWDQLVDRVEASGKEGSSLTASLMRRHVRRLVAAGDLPHTVLDRTQRQPEEETDRAARRAREIAAAHPALSLRDIGQALEAEGIRPPRAECWSAQTVKRLLD